MWPIGNMLWRIGELLDFDQQLAWTREAGFAGVGFHASAGVPGQWRGLEPAACDPTERARLRRELGRFSFAEIHAPFAIELRTEVLAASIAALAPVLKLAQDLGVGVVTVHAQLPAPKAGADLARWLGPMRELDGQAALAQTTVALEIADGFAAVQSWALPRVGINLDVGHMYLEANRHVLAQCGGLGSLIRQLGSGLVHLHLHDVRADGKLDHLELGTGVVAFAELVATLRTIGYDHSMTLELNPDRVTPTGIRRSADHLRHCFREVTSK